MLYRIGLPLIFVFVWSSAFVTAKVGVAYATPFAILLVRFSAVAVMFGVMMACGHWWRARKSSVVPTPDTHSGSTAHSRWQAIGAAAIVGLMLHGLYLGSVFLALSVGLPAGLGALIVSMQPLLSSVLAVFLFSEILRRVQWGGIALGIIGVGVALVPTIAGSIPAKGVLIAFFGLLAITGGTLLQKKMGGAIGLLKGNFIQAATAALFFAVASPLLETPQIDWQLPFIIALGWQILAISGGAYLIFMILIKRDSMAATTSLLFLVPPTTAIMAAIGFDEPLTATSMLGFGLASFGVYLVTRYSSPATP